MQAVEKRAISTNPTQEKTSDAPLGNAPPDISSFSEKMRERRRAAAVNQHDWRGTDSEHPFDQWGRPLIVISTCVR